MPFTSLLKRHAIPLGLAVLVAAWVLTLFVPVVAAWGDETQPAAGAVSISRTRVSDLPELDSAAYLSAYQAKPSAFSASVADDADFPLKNAFDGSWDTAWQAVAGSDGVTVTVTFDEPIELSKIMYKASAPLGGDLDGGSTTGYPQTLTLRASDSPTGAFTEIATTTTSADETRVVFNLSSPVTARRVQLVFGDVEYWDWLTSAGAAELRFLTYDDLLAKAEDLFTDESQTELKPAYDDEDVVAALIEQAQDHPLKSHILPLLEKAQKIIAGEDAGGGEDDKKTDFPVQVIRRTGDDASRIVLFFVGEGYRARDQQGFVIEIRQRVEAMLESEPYRSFADKINVYAMCVESKDEGVGYVGSSYTKDTYFHIMRNIGGSPRRVQFTNDGQAKMTALVKQMEERYLDRGGKVFQGSVLCKSWNRFGTGGTYPIYSLADDAYVMMHELSHSFSDLADEYYDESNASATNKVNKSATDDPAAIKWKPFLGFRGVGIFGNGSGGKEFIPTQEACMMYSYHNDKGKVYCPVCLEHVYAVLNAALPAADRSPDFVASPQLTVKLDGDGYESGEEISSANAASANGKRLELRTVVSNYSATARVYTLRLVITGADGKTRVEASQDVSVAAGEIQSLSLVTGELSGLVDGDTVSARVVRPTGSSTLRFVNEDGTVREAQTRQVSLDETVEPSVDDFDVPVGYAMELPAPATFDGGDDLVLAYRLHALGSGAANATITQLGTSLRYSSDVATQVEGLRFGYTFRVPAGAITVDASTGWRYGLSDAVSAGFREAEARSGVSEASGFTSNIVFTKIPRDSYGTQIYARAQLVYQLEGKTYVVKDEVRGDSVNAWATRVLASAGAIDAERSLARSILGVA